MLTPGILLQVQRMKERDIKLDEHGLFSVMLIHLARQDFVAALDTLGRIWDFKLPDHKKDWLQRAIRQAEQTAMQCQRPDIIKVVSHQTFFMHFVSCKTSMLNFLTMLHQCDF